MVNTNPLRSYVVDILSIAKFFQRRKLSSRNLDRLLPLNKHKAHAYLGHVVIIFNASKYQSLVKIFLFSIPRLSSSTDLLV